MYVFLKLKHLNLTEIVPTSNWTYMQVLIESKKNEHNILFKAVSIAL